MWYFVMLAPADECLYLALRLPTEEIQGCHGMLRKGDYFYCVQRVVMEALFEKQVWENEETLMKICKAFLTGYSKCKRLEAGTR